MRKYKVIILITLTVFVSCRQMPKQESSGDNIDVSHFLNLEQEIRRLSEFVPDIEYFRPLATAGSYFQLMGISYIGPDFVILYEKRTCQLYAYKRDGQFIAKLGAYGNAPLEYRTIPEVFVFQNIEEIHLFDERGRKILRYSFDMEFIGSIKLEIVPKAMAVYNNDYYICSYRNDNIRSLGGLDLIIRDPVSFNGINALWEPVSFEEATDYDKDLLRTYKFFSNRDTLFFVKQTSNEIVIYRIFEGEVTRLLVINLKGDQEDIYDEDSIVQFGAMYFAGYLRLFFQAGREIHYAYYNISSKTISNFRIVNDIDKGPDFFPMGSCEGGGYHGDDLKIPYFIDFWKYGESDNYYNQIQSKYPEREKWLKEIIPNSLEDNPWIMITLSE